MAEEIALGIKADTQQAVSSIRDLRQALKQVKDAMAGLEEGSDEWIELSQKAGEYQHQLEAISESVRGASSDFGDMLGNVTKVGAGMVGIFQSVSAALDIFGVQSKEVTESIKTMQDLMAMTQGLSSIDSMTKALPKLAANIKGTTIAAKALRAALQPKAFLAITAAITAVIFVFQKMKNSEKDLAETQKKLAEETVKHNQEILKSYQDVNNGINSINSDNKKTLTAEYNLAVYQFEKLAKTSKHYSDKQIATLEGQMKAYYNYMSQAANATSEQEAKQAIIGANAIKTLIDAAIKGNPDLEEAYKNMSNLYKVINQPTKKSGTTTKVTVEAEKEITDYTLKRLEYQRDVVTGTKEELDILKQIKNYYSGNLISNESLDNAKTLVTTLKKQAEDIKKQKGETNQDYAAAVAAGNDAVEVYNKLQAAQIANQEGLLKAQREYVATAKELMSAAQTGEEMEELLGKVMADTTVSVEDSADVLNVYIARHRELQNLMDRDSAQKGNLGWNQLRELKQQLTDVNTQIATLKENSIDYYNALNQKRDIEYQIATMEREMQLADKAYEEGAYYQLRGELQYLSEKLDIETEIAEFTKKYYGENSLEYKNELKNLQAINNEIQNVRWSAVNVANESIGYISSLLDGLADTYDDTTRSGFENQKKLSIAATVMNGINGTINAITSWMSPANAWMTAPVQAIMGSLEAASIAAATAAQVAEIKRTTFDGGSTTSSSAVGSLTLVPPTDYTSLVQGAELQDTVSSTKSYVAVTEIEKVSNRVNVAESEARF